MVWLRLARPFTLLPPLLGMLSGAAAAWGAGRHVVPGGEALLLVLAGALMAALLNAASNVLNQVHDLDLDRVNKPERPLPAGEVSVAAARRFSAALYVLAIALAFCIRPAGTPELGFIVLFTAGLTWAYSSPPLRLRSSWWLAPLVIAIPRGGLLKVAGWAALAPVASDREPWILAGVFFLFILGAAPTKDFEDMEGDRRAGSGSLPLRLGMRGAALAMVPFHVLPFIALALLPRLEVAGRPLLSVDPTAALVVGGFLVLHGLLTAAALVRAATRGDVGRGAWVNLYVLMMEAQLGLAALYLFWSA